MPAYLRPRSLPEALAALRDDPGLRVVAGGTDVYPALGDAVLRTPMLDLTALPLRGIRRDDAGGWHIGALTSWTEIARAALPPGLHGLQQAAREVGALQIQNAGTIAGNIVNASPAADGTVALLALDAAVVIEGAAPRVVPLAEFVLGPRRVALAPGELVSAIRIPDPGPAVAGFSKLGARKYLVISIAMVAVVLRLHGAQIAHAGIAVGACSPVARRLPALEARLIGAPLAEAAGLLREGDLADLAPISDVRAEAGYRRAAVPVMLARLLAELAERST